MTDNAYFPASTECPFGVHIDQSWEELGAIFHLICDYKVDTFIEVGVQRGGLSAFMLTRCYYLPEFHYYGFALEIELVSGRVLEMAENLFNAKIHPGNCFSDAVQECTGKLIDRSKVALIYCNGEDKRREFKEYMEILRPGDLILVQGFPREITLTSIKPFIDAGQFKRIVAKYMAETRLLGGMKL